jgi:hypothetical protein
MRTIRFQIQHSHGQVETIHIEGERALLGSGAHCDIRLPIDQSRVEHLRVELGPAGVFATALAFDPPPMLNNVPITQTPVPHDAVITIGQTQIQISVVDAQVAGAKSKAEKRSSPLTLILGVGIVGLLAYTVLGQSDDTEAVDMVAAPELWPAGAAPACPQPPGANAVAFGRDKLALAEAAQERRPFFVADGVKAVSLFETASVCLRGGTSEASSKYAAESAAYLRQDINRDYRKYQVRLARHLDTEEWAAARRDVHQLLELTANLPNNPYRRSLMDRNHDLDLKAGAGVGGAQ